MKYFLFLAFTLIAVIPLQAAQRGSSAPYISGDSFRFSADFTYDDIDKKMNPKSVKEGSTVFVKTDYLEEYFSKIHPNIPSRYILITHNSDHPIPGKFAQMLEDDKIIAWFGQNVEDYSHEKLHPLPIGIANLCWKHGNTNILSKVLKQYDNQSRNILLYMNFSKSTHPTERTYVYNLFERKHYCQKSKPKEFIHYLHDLSRSKFVLSPRGNGLDCHRTWEALYMGAIPIVKSSSIDSLFEGLPVLIINDWNVVNPSFLAKKYEEVRSKSFSKEKLYIDYWLELIDSYR